MTVALQFILAMAIILVAAKAGAWLSVRLRQPAVLGEILVGLLLGPSLIGLFGRPPFTDPHLGETIQLVGEIGVLLLMFVAGLEVNPRDLLRLGKVSALTGTFGVLLPLLGGMVLLAFRYDVSQSLFFGIVMAATSVSISAQTLLDLGKLRTTAGLTLLGAAIIDDVLVIMILSVFIALAGSGGGATGVLIVLIRIAAFLGIGGWMAFRFLPAILGWAERRPVSEALLSSTMAILLLLAWAAEVVGAVAAITGAFLAGLAITQSRLRHKIEEGMHAFSYAFFVPIFLVSIGLRANARELQASDLLPLVVITVVAILSKLIGAGLGARLGGLDGRTSLQVGAGMISRGEVGLIVAATGVLEGLLNGKLFALSVIVVILATVVTPPLLRVLFTGTAGTEGSEPIPQEGGDA